MAAASTTIQSETFASNLSLEDAYVVGFVQAFEELMTLRQLDYARRLVSSWTRRLEEGHAATAQLTPHLAHAKAQLALCA